MIKRKLIFTFGIILIIIGLIFSVFNGVYLFEVFSNPESEALHTIDFKDVDEGDESFTLGEGSYEVWIEGEDNEFEDLDVVDEGGISVFHVSDHTETMSEDDRHFEKAGTLEIEKVGNYTIICEESHVYYITEPLPGVFEVIKRVIFLIVSLSIFLIGVLILVIYWEKSKKEKKRDREFSNGRRV